MMDKLFKHVVYFLSGFFKRDRKKWLFASHTNFGDNSRYFFQDKYNPSNIRKIWIAKNTKECEIVKSMGYECYLKGSFKAKYHSVTAKYFIYTCYVWDIGYQYSRNAICVNLWHGIPLKKIEFDIDSGPLVNKFNSSLISRIQHPEIYRKQDYVLCPSQYVYQYSFKSAFRMKESQILDFPYPRSIFLKNMEMTSKKFEFLYVPTWRDHENNFIDCEILNFSELNKFCIENDCIFNIKFHPNTKIDLDLSEYHHINILDPKDDPNKFLINASCLITDYSSIFFDYLVFNKPILFYVFDEEIYKLKSRGVYAESEKVDCGLKVYDFNDLLNAMRKVLNDNDVYMVKREETINSFGLKFDDKDCRRLYDELNLK